MNIFRRAWNYLSQSWFGPPRLPGETHGMWWGSARTKAGQVITEEVALTISAVYAAVRILSETSASLPLNVYRQVDDRTKELARKHPVYRVIHDAPNEEMTATVFWRTWETYKLLWGNAYAEIGWDPGGNCRALHLIAPWRVEPKRRENGKLYYQIDGGREADIEAADMLHVPNMSLDGITGRSVISFARESLGMTLAAEGYGQSFFGSGGVPSGVLEHPGKLSGDARTNIRTEWNQVHSPAHGGQNAQIAVLMEGMKYNKVGMPPEDAQFLETRGFQIPEICRWFNLPPHFLRDLSRATYSNIEEQGIDFVIYSLTPQLVEREQEINRKLLRTPETYAKHNVYALLRGNMEAQSNFFRELFGVGVLAPNDIRELMDLNPIEGGDEHFVQLQLTTLGRVGEEIDARVREPEPPAAPADKPDEGPAQDDDALARMLTAQRACIVDATRRLVGNELTAVRRASGKPKQFQADLDEFYGRFEGMLHAAILPPVAAFLACGPLRGRADEITRQLAEEHVADSQAALLVASEVVADKLAASVTEATAGWPVARPEQLAAKIERMADDAKPTPVIRERVRRVERDPQGRISRIVEEGG